jgi:hypothetical protein
VLDPDQQEVSAPADDPILCQEITRACALLEKTVMSANLKQCFLGETNADASTWLGASRTVLGLGCTPLARARAHVPH